MTNLDRLKFMLPASEANKLLKGLDKVSDAQYKGFIANLTAASKDKDLEIRQAHDGAFAGTTI